jgi:hypothetical protein
MKVSALPFVRSPMSTSRSYLSTTEVRDETLLRTDRTGGTVTRESARSSSRAISARKLR